MTYLLSDFIYCHLPLYLTLFQPKPPTAPHAYLACSCLRAFAPTLPSAKDMLYKYVSG